jgi:hypothetical protein
MTRTSSRSGGVSGKLGIWSGVIQKTIGQDGSQGQQRGSRKRWDR